MVMEDEHENGVEHATASHRAEAPGRDRSDRRPEREQAVRDRQTEVSRRGGMETGTKSEPRTGTERGTATGKSHELESAAGGTT